MEPLAPVEPLKTTEPVLAPVVPRVRALAAVKIPVAPWTEVAEVMVPVEVVLILPAVEILPKPVAMEPVVRAPTVMRLVDPVQVERAVFSTLFKASMVLTWAVLRARG